MLPLLLPSSLGRLLSVESRSREASARIERKQTGGGVGLRSASVVSFSLERSRKEMRS